MNEKYNGAAAPVVTKTVTPEHIENHDSGILLYDDDGHVRRLPVPSSSPNDPLNFGPWRQRLILLAVCLYGVTGFGVIQVTPLFFGKLIPVYKAQTQGGLTAGVADCLLPIIVLDMTFLDQRSSRLVAYWALTAVGSSLLTVPIPFLAEISGASWRVGYWFWAVFAALSLVMVVLFVPETLVSRQAAQLDGKIHVTDAYGTHRTFLSPEAAREAGFDVASDQSEEQAEPKSYLRQLAPFTVQASPVSSFLCAYRDIFACLLVPGTLWALLFNSMIFGGLVVLSLTYTQTLEMEPWHFSASTVGTVQVGAAIGSLLGLAFGEIAEPISRWLTRRNNGIREPEHVLPNFAIPTVLAFAAMVIYGTVGADPHSHSWVGIHAAFALFYFGFCAVSALTGVWLSELLPHMSGPAIVLTCGGRNAVSFGYSSSFNSWIAALGFQNTYILFGGILFALGGLALPLYFVNGSIRRSMWGVKWLNAY
ncbi:serine/threonine kinase 16 [Microdochium nivale]|nr:serine/threonine kinase 16 [Microdochium nivale]